MILSGVNKIITTKEINLNPSKYSKVFSGYGINIFEPIILPRWIYGSCIITNINSSYTLLSKVDLKLDINNKNGIFSQENNSKKYCNSEPKISNARIHKKSSEVIFNISDAGIVFLNLGYNKNINAYDNNTNNKLQVIKCNVAFTCIKADQLNGPNEIKVIYERPSLKKIFDL
jgi:hypothetical protein